MQTKILDESSQLNSLRDTRTHREHELDELLSKFEEEKLTKESLERKLFENKEVLSRSQSGRNELTERLVEKQMIAHRIDSKLEEVRCGTREAENGCFFSLNDHHM